MGLQDDVINTQTGGVKKEINVPDVNLSSRQQAQQSQQPQVSEQIPQETQASVAPTEGVIPQNETQVGGASQSDDQWKSIYQYMQDSDGFQVKIDYNDFVKKYSQDDDKRRNLFSHITRDSQKKGLQSPFSSSNIKDFEDSETNILKTSGTTFSEALGGSETPDITQEESMEKIDTPESSINAINSASSIARDPKINPDDDISNKDAVNSIGRKVRSAEDFQISVEPNPLIGENPAHVDNDANLFNFFLSPPDASGIDKYDVMGDLRTDINTGLPMDLEDRHLEEKERLEKWRKIKLEEDTAKSYIDNYFNTVREMLSNGSITYEQIDSPFFDINNFASISSAGDKGMNEKLLATFHFNPKLAEYYQNSLNNMKGTAGSIIKTRDVVRIREEISNDFDTRMKTDGKSAKIFEEKFGSTLPVEVFLLNNKHYNSFVNTYAAMGYNVKDVKDTMDSMIKEHVYAQGREDMLGWRSQVKSQIDDSLTGEEREAEFYLRYTEMMDREGLKYMNQDQKEAAILNSEINLKIRERDLGLKDGSWSLKDEKELQDLLAQRDEYWSEDALYDPETGKLLEEGEANEIQISWNDGVKKFESIYKDTDLDKLYKRREELYFQLNWLNRNITDKHTYKAGQSSQGTKWSKDEKVEIRYADGKTETVDFDDTGFTHNSWRAREVGMPYTYGMVKDIRQELTALNNLILFNQSPESVSKMWMPQAAWKTFNETLGGEDEEHWDNEVKYQINALRSSGFKLNASQEARLEDGIWQNVGSAIGGSLPAMGEILFWTVIAKNVGGAIGALGNAEKVISTVSRGNKMVEGVLTATNNFMQRHGIYQAVNTGAVYELSGQGFSTGIGESFGQGMANKVFNAKLKKNFFAQFAARLFGGSTGETIEEYSGEFVNNLEKSGFDIQSSLSETIGDDPLEKLLITYAVSMVMSTPTSGFRTIENVTMRKYIEENMDKFPNKEAVEEVLSINNEDGKFEERGKKLVAKDVNQDSLKVYKTLKKKEDRGEELSESEKLEVSRFENSVVYAKEELSDDMTNEISRSFPDLLEKDFNATEIVDGVKEEVTEEVTEETKKKPAAERIAEEAQEVGNVEEKIEEDATEEVETDRVGEQGGKEQVPDRGVEGESITEEAGESVQTGDKSEGAPKKRNLKPEENEKVKSIKEGDELQVLKDELGMSNSKATSAKQVQRAYNKRKDADTETFMKAVNRAKGDLDSSVSEVSQETKSDIENYANIQSEIKRAEQLIKEGKVDEGVSVLEAAKESSKTLIDEGDRARVESSVDKKISVAKAGAVKFDPEAKAAKEAEEAAKKIEESKKALEGVRDELIGNEATVGDLTGEVLKVDRKSGDSEYEVLIKRDDKRAVKASYNPETGEMSPIPQDKATELSQMSNFKASKGRESTSKKEGRAERTESLSKEVAGLAKEAGMVSTRGKNAGKPKASVKSLLSKIAYVEAEGATESYLDAFNSELNGLIKDDASTPELKLKRKLQNLMKKAQGEMSSEPKIDEAKKTEKKAEKPVKPKKVKKTGKTEYDNAKQTLENAKPELSKMTLKEFVQNTKIDGKPFAAHVLNLKEDGKITEQEYNELQDDYKKIWSEKKIMEENSIKVAEDMIEKTGTSFDDMDESLQTQRKGIGSNKTESTGRVQPRTVTKAQHKKFSANRIIKRLLSRADDVPTPTEMISRLAKATKTKLFTKSSSGKGEPNWLGKFTRSANAVTLRKKRDIDTFIHEIGHKIAFKYNLNEIVSDGSFDAELGKLWVHGSNPPKQVKTEEGIKAYKRNEGLAEFIRAYSINPEAAIAMFPNLSLMYENNVPTKDIIELDKFGVNYAIIANMTNGDYSSLLMTGYKPQSKVSEEGNIENSFAKRLARDTSQLFSDMFSRKGEGFKIGFWTNLNNAVFEKSGALRKAVNFAKKKGAEMSNSSNPYYLIRLMSNFQRNRLKNLVERGLVDAFGQRVLVKKDSSGKWVVSTDGTGQLMNYGWLYENLDTSSEAKLDKDIELVEKLLMAEGIKSRKEEQAKQLIEKAESNGEQLTMEQALAMVPDVTGAGYGLVSEQKIVEETLNELKSLDPETYKKIQDAAARYRAFALQTVRYLKDTGRITEEHFNDIEANQDNYVSFRAAMDEISDGSFNKYHNKNIKSVLDLKKRGAGSDVMRDNPYSNLTAVLMESYYEGDRNHAVRSYVDMLSDVNEVRSSSNKVDGDVEIKYYDKGEVKKAWVSPEFAMALENATRTDSPIKLFDILGRLFKDLPQTMITSTPAFASKNLIRDKAHQLFISRRRFNPVKDLRVDTQVLRDLKEKSQIYKLQVKKRELEKRKKSLSEADAKKLDRLMKSQADSAGSVMELYGGSMSGWYFRDRSNYYGLLNQVKKDLVREGRTVFWRPQRFMNPAKAWNKWHKGVAKTEEINRLHEFRETYKAEYKKWKEKLLEEGVPLKDAEIRANHEANIRAAFEAKDLMDFTVAGHMMTNVNRIFMFLNPALQGWNRTIKTFRPDDPKSWMSISLRLAIYSAIPTIMERLWAAYNGDEDELVQQPSYQKDMFWNFKIAPNTWFRTPKPFEFGMISSGFQRLYDYQVNSDPNAFDDYAKGLKEMFVPIDGTSLLDNPFVQLYTGRDEFLGKDVVPYYEQKLDLELRDPKYSSELGKKVHDIGLMDARKFDHFMKKTFSGWGNLMLNIGDRLLGDDSPDPLFSQRDVGVLSESPLYASRDYQAVKKMGEEYGLSYKNDVFDELNALKDKHNKSTSNEEKDKISEKFWKESKKQRAYLDGIIEREGNLESIGGKGDGSKDSKDDSGGRRRKIKDRRNKRERFKRR